MPQMNTIFSRGMPELRQHLLHLGENRIIAAAGAPANVLIAGEIVGGEGGGGSGGMVIEMVMMTWFDFRFAD